MYIIDKNIYLAYQSIDVGVILFGLKRIICSWIDMARLCMFRVSQRLL